MSNKRVKAIDDYDDDGFGDEYDDGYDEHDDGYGEEEKDTGQGLSAEDEERMVLGTVQVKQQLGDEFPALDMEIQDALWHYFFDVGKSVTYIKNLRKPVEKKVKSKPVSKFDQVASAAAKKDIVPIADNFGLYPTPVSQTCFSSAAEFFQDVPWGQVPISRLATLSHRPMYPGGGLLGGSSKLAKLAALRKQKEQKNQAASLDTDAGRSIAILDRLSVKKENDKDISTALHNTSLDKPKPTFPIRQKRAASPIREPEPKQEETPPPPSVPKSELLALPSVFAQTIFGQETPCAGGASLDTSHPSQRGERRTSDAFTLPFMNNPEFMKHSPFSGPSPDDIVLRAQSKGIKSSNNGKATNGIAKDVAALSVNDTPKTKSKNLNVADEFKKAKMKNSASFVVVGHVDHGKSTLMGRLLYDLGVVDEKQVEKLRREAKKIGKSSFALAWVMDATSDERERGITVDVATNHFETSKTRFTILDAPGHQDFIPNMIAGASQADFAVLVIDASPNSFESGLRGQTKEHALLVRSMGVQRLIVAVNKMDACEWSEDRFTEIKQQMTAFLTSANFSTNTLTFVPCAGLTGENINAKPTTPNAAWYSGTTLVEELDASEPSKRNLEKPLRMTISEIFRSSTQTTVSVSGKLDSGSLQVGDVITVMPSGETATIKTLEADGAASSEWAVAGQIAVLNLIDIDPVHLKLGDIISHPSNPISNVKEFTAKILAFEHVLPMFVDVHRGPLHVGGKVTQLVAVLDKVSGKELGKKKVRVVQPGSVARVVVELESGLPVEAGGKVILRSEGLTVAAGLVE
ncbi:elongation factor tu gtp binding domain-containing protein [Venturia nashicola]|nr:elongation factor tu gtp binding domain-containing protein [Venturia nashicola]